MTSYPFGTEAIIHIPEPQLAHKLNARGLVCQLLKPLAGSGSWLLWDCETNFLLQLESVSFMFFQHTGVPAVPEHKGSVQHVLNLMMLREVPTESLFAKEMSAIDCLPLAKNIMIPQHLGQALGGPHQDHWKGECMAEVTQMEEQDVWEIQDKDVTNM
ncbi:hypothetical protein O181_067018 [Austropuccinia psidii MF-1]|uniref:Uncharacterized protein n=1 Tax=Austropuccinia psidii MF-1 TaxID=1389203 RepID=A0A9Q3I450_9BASI|nr:hypothetical protein [Austropuccinia psidii MF-1]